jgi:hypothetical protein
VAPSPKPAVCPVKQGLTDLFLAAVRELMELQEAELVALQEGTSLARFDVAMDAARSKKEKIKEEYLLTFSCMAARRHATGLFYSRRRGHTMFEYPVLQRPGLAWPHHLPDEHCAHRKEPLRICLFRLFRTSSRCNMLRRRR